MDEAGVSCGLSSFGLRPNGASPRVGEWNGVPLLMIMVIIRRDQRVPASRP